MTGHAAVAVRMNTGWKRWVARCPDCGWFEWPRTPGGREEATALAEAHNARWTR